MVQLVLLVLQVLLLQLRLPACYFSARKVVAGWASRRIETQHHAQRATTTVANATTTSAPPVSELFDYADHSCKRDYDVCTPRENND